MLEMRKHFNNKKPCPSVAYALDLTDEIKEHILINRIFTPPIPDKKQNAASPINQTINNFHTMNNFVANMDVIEKITRLVSHTKLPHIGYEDNIRIKYDDDADYLRNPKNRRVESVAMKPDDLMLIIDSVTKASQGLMDAVEINVLYDNKAKKIRLFQDGVWDDTIVSIGLKRLIQSIQENYLDEYEQYLICKSRNEQTHFTTKALIKDLIRDYYRFISAFEIYPFVTDKANNKFRLGSSNEFDIEEEFMGIYNKVSNEMTKSSVKRFKRMF